ncbi:L,D-transpeptidase family protein [Brumimicrobium aurantiacum]|uniref:L,D-TPase catalytic domain-containing protein n=1 Tax=Brumimicrobium aurantiacum TaxID=1737063 RepID=A0A3E1EZG9_9FLAO|nr:L,D-transpeptidase family protein [Brumimicrobium aurantiacum]RFC54961.1 hypothetical protein DXU93_03835 [Brumimicrobium aurantiacum]
MKNKIYFFSILLSSLLLFTCCGNDDEFKENELNGSQKEEQKNIRIDKITIDDLKIKDSYKSWLHELYEKVDYTPFWIQKNMDKDSIGKFLNYINSDVTLNLPFKYLSSPTFLQKDAPIKKELLSILRCASFLSLKDTTIINYQNNSLVPVQLVSQDAFLQFIQEKSPEENWIHHLLHYKENNPQLIQLHLALNEFTSNFGVENNVNEKIYLKTPEDSLARLFITQQLNLRNYLNDTISDTTLIKNKLREFQLLNGLNTDAKLGKNTMEALKETNYSRYIKGVITLDKMRLTPDSLLNTKMITVNIPSYNLAFLIDNKVVNTSKIIIGTKNNQTPEFASVMKYIVVNPYWNVPYSISSREILPNLKKDSTYLAKKNYEVLDNGKNPINTDSINWNMYNARNFPFFIRQKPGPSNSLGRVKLMFPNNQSIYIHDTPSKYLFAKDHRAFSHGCIRTQSPFQLVNDILVAEEHPYLDSIEVFKKKEEETYLILNEKFPVNLVYHTAGINDSTQQIQFYKDIYTKEKALYQLFEAPFKEF